jgi:site-specific DNA recombinase
MKRRREIIVPVSVSPHDLRPIRAETRATFVAAIARGRRWLDEIVADTVTRVEQIMNGAAASCAGLAPASSLIVVPAALLVLLALLPRLKRFPPDLNRRDSKEVIDERVFVH